MKMRTQKFNEDGEYPCTVHEEGWVRFRHLRLNPHLFSIRTGTIDGGCPTFHDKEEAKLMIKWLQEFLRKTEPKRRRK